MPPEITDVFRNILWVLYAGGASPSPTAVLFVLTVAMQFFGFSNEIGKFDNALRIRNLELSVTLE